MPGTDELEYRDFQDFTGGLWQRGNDRECVPNGLLECTDCFPQPQGGLRAFAKFQPMGANITAAGTVLSNDPAWILGIWFEIGGGFGELFCMTMQGTAAPYTFNLLTLRIAGSLTVPERALTGARPGGVGKSDWQAALTRADITSIEGAIKMASFVATAPTSDSATYFNLPIVTSSTVTTMSGGVYRMDPSGGTTAFFVFGNPISSARELLRGLWAYQARLVTLAVDDFTNNWMHIVYTDPGSYTVPPVANVLEPLGETPSGISLVEPFPPSDLFFIKDVSAIGSIQGTLTAPTIRAMGYSHLHPRGWPVKTDIGLVLVIANEGAFAWTGEQLEYISPAIRGDAMGGTPYNAVDGPRETVEDGCDLRGAANWNVVSLGSEDIPANCSGQLGTYENWVFFNNGYMLDTRTGAWFTQTSAPGARWWAQDMLNRRMYVSCNFSFSNVNSAATPATPLFWSRMGEGSWTPMHTYSYTVPLIESPGQRTNLREIEYDLTTYNDASTLTVEISSASGDNDETLGPYDLANTRPDSVRVVFGGHPEEWYKVRTILKSNRSGEEAPTLSKMRVGTQASTRNPVNKVNG